MDKRDRVGIFHFFLNAIFVHGALYIYIYYFTLKWLILKAKLNFSGEILNCFNKEYVVLLIKTSRKQDIIAFENIVTYSQKHQEPFKLLPSYCNRTSDRI